LSYEEFLSLAKTLGLNVEGPHWKELFTYIQEVFPGLRKIEELDLSDLEPMTSPSPLSRSKGEEEERES
jgi:Asp-tRNA(Asn)/Glu-tRNA(Gln) amidotransferase C subunit